MMGMDLYEANGVDANTWVVPILGTKRLYRLEENDAAADVQRSAEHLNKSEQGPTASPLSAPATPNSSTGSPNGDPSTTQNE